MDVTWEVRGLRSEKTRGLLGDVSEDGIYVAPQAFDHDIDFYIVATPVQHPEERQRVKIQLRQRPSYDQPYKVTVDGTQFEINVIDKSHSWIIGSNELDGEDGAGFAKRMAADGVFNGFREIICVGAASREYKLKSKEELRALERANLLGQWVRRAVPRRDIGIYALKIGRYDEDTTGLLTPAQTTQERQVVIVGVVNAERNGDRLSALRKAFAEKRAEEPLLGMYLDKYPEENWRLEPVRRSQ
jgi:hypothetical protein